RGELVQRVGLTLPARALVVRGRTRARRVERELEGVPRDRIEQTRDTGHAVRGRGQLEAPSSAGLLVGVLELAGRERGGKVLDLRREPGRVVALREPLDRTRTLAGQERLLLLLGEPSCDRAEPLGVHRGHRPRGKRIEPALELLDGSRSLDLASCGAPARARRAGTQ